MLLPAYLMIRSLTIKVNLYGRNIVPIDDLELVQIKNMRNKVRLKIDLEDIY